MELNTESREAGAGYTLAGPAEALHEKRKCKATRKPPISVGHPGRRSQAFELVAPASRSLTCGTPLPFHPRSAHGRSGSAFLSHSNHLGHNAARSGRDPLLVSARTLLVTCAEERSLGRKPASTLPSGLLAITEFIMGGAATINFAHPTTQRSRLS